MIVVSDTSPLTNLAAIDHFRLLQKLFGEIQIAEGVWRELNAGGRRHPGSREVERSSWVRRHVVGNEMLVTALRRDRGDEGAAGGVLGTALICTVGLRRQRALRGAEPPPPILCTPVELVKEL